MNTKLSSLQNISKIINIRRVAKVVKGGRRFSFSALIVVGNGINKIGFGFGKAKEIPDAIKKGKNYALKHTFTINVFKNTIPHKIIGTFNAGAVIMYPVPQGTGIISGSTGRAIFEALGIKNICAKSFRSKNCSNIVRAIITGLSNLTTYSEKLKQLKNI
jgi:small subunit ribosomal protein S5